MASSISGGASPSVTASQDDQPKKKAVTPLSVFVKPDYHLLGVEEQLTTSERCRFWLHSWLRGGSPVLVARVNPMKGVVSSWQTYSPESLIYGDKSDLPVGKYLLKPQDTIGPSTFGRRRGGVQVLMATANFGSEETPVVDLYSFMPKTMTDDDNGDDDGALAATATVSRSKPIFSTLPAWNRYDRIPYTYQTGMYCVPFFLEGRCPNVFKDTHCGHLHLRLAKQSPRTTMHHAKSKRMCFDNYTKVLKKATTRNQFELLNQPQRVMLNYAFCGEETVREAEKVTTIASLSASIHCSKIQSECKLPHLTLHQVLERLADDLLRKGRGKRRAEKTVNRHQHSAV
uniref:Uncharacterized protein n=1 Tax=Hyaloperonospora arabidopsidis (strain Emoy2) TaxID=559515 RepID=M4BCE0_HYAAE